MNCENCDNDIDYEYQVSEKINDLLRHYDSKDKVKEFLDNEFDWSINQACDVCYCTYWVEDEDKPYWYEVLDGLKN